MKGTSGVSGVRAENPGAWHGRELWVRSHSVFPGDRITALPLHPLSALWLSHFRLAEKMQVLDQ